MIRGLALSCALLLTSCGPKALTLPEDTVDAAATCAVVAAAQARAATSDIKADLPFDATVNILHYPLLAGSTGDEFSGEAAANVQLRMTELQDSIIEGKWQPLIPACKAKFPATAVETPKLPTDRFKAQLACYQLADFIRTALDETADYEGDLRPYRDLVQQLDPSLGAIMQVRAGATATAQREERDTALATASHLGPPAAVMRKCLADFGK